MYTEMTQMVIRESTNDQRASNMENKHPFIWQVITQMSQWSNSLGIDLVIKDILVSVLEGLTGFWKYIWIINSFIPGQNDHSQMIFFMN